MTNRECIGTHYMLEKQFTVFLMDYMEIMKIALHTQTTKNQKMCLIAISVMATAGQHTHNMYIPSVSAHTDNTMHVTSGM